MKIASLYPLMQGQEISGSVFDWDFIRAVLRYSDEVNEFHVFLPLDAHPPDPFPDVSHVSVHSVMELSTFFQEHSIDVWHDFGYTDVSRLTYIRRLSHQNFPITLVVPPARLVLDQIESFGGLAEYDALICSKPSIQSVIRSAYERSSECIPSPDLDAEVFTIPSAINTTDGAITNKRDARYLLDLPEQAVIILCLADFSVYEGGDLFPLIHAFQTVVEKHENVRLVISGSDEYEYAEKIQTFLNNSNLHRHVLLRPDASESAQSLLLSAADIFILASDAIHRDNQIQMLRAMSNGLPVIATDDEDQGCIEHGKNGLKLKRLCQPSSYESLNRYLPLVSDAVKPLIISQGIVVDTQQIIAFLSLLIEDETLRQTLGEAGRCYVEANHQWSTLVERYVHLWQTLREKVASEPHSTDVAENQVSNNDAVLLSANTGELPFFSFISQGVESDTDLHLTPAGEMLLETQHLISYDAMKDIIYHPIIFVILNMSKSGASMSKLIDLLLPLAEGDATADLVPNITYHVMWCMKQGFISPS